MTELQASRTLVKSPPELWAECSDAASLARHLGAFGEIRITRLEPETAVAWEGERARGTVRIEPAGWGTKVILTALEMSGDPSPVSGDSSPVPGGPPLVPGGPSPPEEPEAAEAPEPPETPTVTVVDAAPPGTSVEAERPDTSAKESPPARRRRFAWLFGRRRRLAPEPGMPPESAVLVQPEPQAAEPESPSPGEAKSPFSPEPLRPPELVPIAVLPPPPELSPPAVVQTPSEPPPPPEPATATSDTEAALNAALDSLGQAHHRPYSRA